MKVTCFFMKMTCFFFRKLTCCKCEDKSQGASINSWSLLLDIIRPLLLDSRSLLLVSFSLVRTLLLDIISSLLIDVRSLSKLWHTSGMPIILGLFCIYKISFTPNVGLFLTLLRTELKRFDFWGRNSDLTTFTSC